MKKIVAVPVVAVIAAVGAASAAGFAGGVSAGPIQSGDASDLTCANSARVIEWGSNDHLNPPNVVNARIQLNDAHCQGQGIHLITLKADGTEQYRAASAKIDPSQPSGVQYARLTFNTPVPISELNAVRITVDPGYASLPVAPTS
jgi:hypothetical protein